MEDFTYLKAMKKYELHCHLDGSLSEECIRALAKKAGISLPESGLQERLTADKDCKSLREYLTKFDLPLACLTSEESFTLAVKDVMKAAAEEHTEAMEIRFAPMLSERDNLSVRSIIEGAVKGLQEGEREFGIQANLILCGMRHFDPAKNVELAKLAADYYGYGVCALDLAGDEAAFPVKLHTEMFRTAKALGIPYTIHAGECGSVQSVWDAIELGASRIGHGIAAIQDPALVKYCAEHKIPFEICPSSNFQTKAAKDLEAYPLKAFLQAGIPVTLNTDNRTVSGTTLTKEYETAVRCLGVTREEAEKIVENGKNALFCGKE